MRIQEAMGMGVPAGNAIGIAGTCSETFTATGTVSADAAVLTAANTLVTTGANNTGVRVPSDAQIGDEFTVGVATGNGVIVYPHTGGKVNNGSTDAGITIPSVKSAKIKRVGPTHWICVLSA